MAELTTAAGEVIDFDPAAVTALSDRDAAAGEAVTCVWGLAAGVLKTSEGVPALLARPHLAAAFARLTRPDGASVWLAAKAVFSVRAPWEAEYATGVRAVVSAGALVQGVKETPQEVRRRVHAHGGAVTSTILPLWEAAALGFAGGLAPDGLRIIDARHEAPFLRSGFLERVHAHRRPGAARASP